MAKKAHSKAKVGFRAPKYQKAVRQYDLAPTGEDYIDTKTKQIIRQKMGAAPTKRRKADTKGLEPELKLKSAPSIKLKAEIRPGETLQRFENRLKLEKERVERAQLSGFDDVRVSSRRIEYKRDRRHDKADRKRAKETDKALDDHFRGSAEKIAFGDVVQRPPSFADLKLPGAVSLEPKRMSNLEKLSKALDTATTQVQQEVKSLRNDNVRLQAMVDNDDSENDSDDDYLYDKTEQKLRQQRRILKQLDLQKRQAQQADRARALEDARKSHHALELEKMRYQSQLAYQQMKAKRSKTSASTGASMADLTRATDGIRREDRSAMKTLSDVDGGVYHHGRR